MNTEEAIHVRNSLWRKISENVSLENISTLARSMGKAFRKLVPCRRNDDTFSLASEEDLIINKPIYTGPKIEVPWKGEEFRYPTDRYLTNKETLKQLHVLELRFRAQSKILRDKKQKIHTETAAEERCKREAMAKSIRQSNAKFAELRNLVKAFKKHIAKKRLEKSKAIKEEKNRRPS